MKFLSAEAAHSRLAVSARALSRGPPAALRRMTAGFCPAWVLAVGICCISSAASVSGFVLQKMVLRDPKEVSRWAKIGDITLSPKWFVGFLLAALVPIPANLLVYALAPMSLTTPLSGVTVVLNIVLAPTLLGERVQPWPDVPATVLIVVGMIITTCFGAHQEQATALESGDLLRLGQSRVFLVAGGVILAMLVTCLVCMVIFTRAIDEAAVTRPANPPMLHVLLPGLAAATAGCFSNIGLKAFVELLQAEAPWAQLVLCLLVGTLPFAVLQLNFVNRGLRLYLQTIFFPVYNALLVILNTITASIFYQEYLILLASGDRFGLFWIGVAVVAVGIGFFGLRVPESRESEQLLSDSKTQ